MEVLDGLSSGNQTSQCKKTGSAVMKPRGSIDPSVFVSGSPERPKTRHGFLSIHGLMFGLCRNKGMQSGLKFQFYVSSHNLRSWKWVPPRRSFPLPIGSLSTSI